MTRTAVLVAALLAPLPAVALPPATIASRVAEHGPAARSRLAPAFARAGIAYPPRAVTLVGLKREERLEVYAGSVRDAQAFITSYPILAASGGPGPKLREGDLQVPEGVYAIESLNPNSRYHLALRVGYPNALDRRRGRDDGRRNLGGDIMIHGNAVSIGCLAMGDTVAEDLFVLAADAGLAALTVVLTPHDLRREPPPMVSGAPAWTPELYAQIQAALATLPARQAVPDHGSPLLIPNR